MCFILLIPQKLDDFLLFFCIYSYILNNHYIIVFDKQEQNPQIYLMCVRFEAMQLISCEKTRLNCSTDKN